MSYTIIPNQALKLVGTGETSFNDLAAECNCTGQDWCQPKNQDDSTSFQIGLGTIDGDNLVADGDFDGTPASAWTLGGNWAIAAGVATHTVGAGGDLTQDMNNIIAINKYYWLIFSIENASGTGNIDVILGGVTLITLNVATYIGDDTTFNLYKIFAVGEITDQDLIFRATGAASGFNIDDVVLFELCAGQFYIQNIQTDEIPNVFNADATEIDRFEEAALITFDFLNTPDEGCYKICMLCGPDNEFTAGDFGTHQDNVTGLTSDNPNTVQANPVRSTTEKRTGLSSAFVEFKAAAPVDGDMYIANITLEANTRYTAYGWIYNTDSAEADLVRIGFEVQNMSGLTGLLPMSTFNDELGSDFQMICLKFTTGTDISGQLTIAADVENAAVLAGDDYYIDDVSIVKGSETIKDGGLNQDYTFWTTTGDVEMVDGIANFGAGTNNTMSQTLTSPIANTIYKFSIRVIEITGTLTVNLFNTTFDITEAGDYFRYLASPDDVTGAELEFSTLIGTNLSINDISVIDVAPEFCSECLNVKTDWGCSTNILSWTNNETAFGIDYENFVYTQFMRLESKLWKPKYITEQEDFTDNAGSRTLLWARSRKQFDLTIRDVPEYIHDALRLGVIHDTFNIEGEQYIKLEGDYEPEWRNSSLTAPITIEVTPQTEDMQNSNC